MHARILLFSALLVCAGTARADLFRLGEGREIRGKVLKETAESYFVDVGFTVVELPKKAVLSREDDAKPAAGAAKQEAARVSDALYSTIRREEMTVKANVGRTGGAVVMVQTPSGLGSGFIITPDGYVVTNDHVIEGETKITVMVFRRGKDNTLEKQQISKVKIVALNAYVDLALLKLEGVKDLPIAYLGDSGKLRQGQPLFAIGNPLGLERSVSSGIVSVKNRPFGGQIFIQTTTQINPGNSGGPLFDLKGEVVGVTNMKITGGEGLSFAIPVDAVKRFLKARDAFLYDKDNPNSGYRYLPPPAKPKAAASG